MPNYASDALREKVESAPRAPGCYLFLDDDGGIIYIGKSKCLHNRVRSYFGLSAQKDERITDLIRAIRDVRFVQTETELDALIEEYRLIKRHKPWFNSQHIRDIRPCFLRIQMGDPCPRVTIEREPEPGGKYIGPVGNAFRAEELIDLMGHVWHTPFCGRERWPASARPCLHHQMGHCLAPCCPAAPPAPYPYADELAEFLAGRPEAALDRLRDEMATAAANMQFELAGLRKKELAGLEQLADRVRYSFRILPSTTGLLLMRGYGEEAFSVFLLAGGYVGRRVRFEAGTTKAQARKHFAAALKRGGDEPPDDPAMAACLSEIAAYKRFAPLSSPGDAEETRAAFAALLAQR